MRGIIKDGGVPFHLHEAPERSIGGAFSQQNKEYRSSRTRVWINRCGIYCELCEAAAGLCLFMCVYLCDVCLCEVMLNVQIH